MFFSAKLIATTSPGSIALLVGAHPSNTSAVESRTTTGLLFTRTEKVFVALSRGVPSSRTRVLKKLLELFCARLGVQVMMPVFASIKAPLGVASRE